MLTDKIVIIRYMIYFALLGWYLMLPPTAQRNGNPWPDGRAPLGEWATAKSFDTAKACETEVDKHRRVFEKAYREVSHNDSSREFRARFFVVTAGEATCIASDDPRLREEAERDDKRSQSP